MPAKIIHHNIDIREEHMEYYQNSCWSTFPCVLNPNLIVNHDKPLSTNGASASALPERDHHVFNNNILPTTIPIMSTYYIHSVELLLEQNST